MRKKLLDAHKKANRNYKLRNCISLIISITLILILANHILLTVSKTIDIKSNPYLMHQSVKVEVFDILISIVTLIFIYLLDSAALHFSFFIRNQQYRKIISILFANNDSVPIRLIDQVGVQHNAYTFLWLNDTNNIYKLYAKPIGDKLYIWAATDKNSLEQRSWTEDLDTFLEFFIPTEEDDA